MSSSRLVVNAPDAPAAVGPYSHAVQAGDLLFCSGQVALDPSTGELVGDTPTEQARQCLENLQRVCAAGGTTLERAVRCTVLLTDIAAFADVNAVYEEFFDAEPPARIAYAVAALPKGAQVEIDAVVAL